MIDNSIPAGPFIAIADDHPIMRAALRTALQALGPERISSRLPTLRPRSSLVAEHEHLDLLLLDLNMPGAHGLDTVRAVRQRAPQLPVAVVSAEQQSGTAAALLALGVEDSYQNLIRPT